MERVFKCKVCSIIQFNNDICTQDGIKMHSFDLSNLTTMDRSFEWTDDLNKRTKLSPRHEFLFEDVHESILITAQETINDMINRIEKSINTNINITDGDDLDLNQYITDSISRVPSIINTVVSVDEIIQSSKTSYDFNQLFSISEEDNVDLEDLVDVVFSVVVPKTCIETNSRIRICFLMDKSYQRLDFKTTQEIRDFDESNAYSLILTTVQFPSRILNANINILYYYYYFVNQDQLMIEKLLTELKQLRHLSLEHDKRKTNLKYDGFALFKNVEYKSNQTELKRLKETIVNYNVHIEALRHESIKEIHADFIDKVVRFYDSLCVDDDQYKAIFEQVNLK